MSDTNERSVASVGSVAGGVSDRSKPIERTPAPHATQGDGTEQRECTEPVAWLVEGCEYDTGCEFQYVAMLKEQADAAAVKGARLAPLYRQPPPAAWQLVHDNERLRDEVMLLRCAIRNLLKSVNDRYPLKNQHEWGCQHMAELDRLVSTADSK